MCILQPKILFAKIMSLKGRCACKAINYSIGENPKTFHACYCATCQAWSGGVLLSVEAGKNPTIDDPDGNLAVWKSSPWAERGFCKTCGSSLFYRVTAPGPLQGSHYFCPGGIEDWGDMKLDKELYVDCKPSGYCFQTGPDHVAMTKAQVEAMFASSGDDDTTPKEDNAPISSEPPPEKKAKQDE